MFWVERIKKEVILVFNVKLRMNKNVEIKPQVTIIGRSNPEDAGSIHRDCINLQAQILIWRYTLEFLKCLHTCVFMDFT